MTTDVETIIVGAGVVGLAIARALAMAGHEVIVTERHDLIGSETSRPVSRPSRQANCR